MGVSNNNIYSYMNPTNDNIYSINNMNYFFDRENRIFVNRLNYESEEDRIANNNHLTILNDENDDEYYEEEVEEDNYVNNYHDNNNDVIILNDDNGREIVLFDNEQIANRYGIYYINTNKYINNNQENNILINYYLNSDFIEYNMSDDLNNGKELVFSKLETFLYDIYPNNISSLKLVLKNVNNLKTLILTNIEFIELSFDNDNNNDELSNDELSNDEFSNDEFSNDEFSNDELSNDEFSNDEFSNDNSENGSVIFDAKITILANGELEVYNSVDKIIYKYSKGIYGKFYNEKNPDIIIPAKDLYFSIFAYT